MTRLLIAGVGPGPQPGQHRVFAPGLRLHSIAAELVRGGHDVALCEALFPGAAEDAGNATEGVSSWHRLPAAPDAAAPLIARAADGHRAEAIVALTDGIALAAVRSGFDGPLHVDWFGHPMAERQMLCGVHGNDDSLAGQWLYVLPVLLRADSFSGCSNAQRLAITGELGAAGRLGSKTCGHELVRILKPPNPFTEEFAAMPSPYLRGSRVPKDARIVLFTGGYNTWLDEETLFDAVDRVLAEDPRAVYVSTGGSIEGHVSVVFERFHRRVQSSAHRDRYVFLGWVAHEEFVQCCLEADVGVVCDQPTLEGELGCRNRLYGWLWGGMRAVATSLSEIQRTDLEPLGLVHGVPLKNTDAFAAAVAEELRRGRCTPEEADAQRALLREKCSPGEFYGPLLEWVRDPQPAPDRAEGDVATPLAALQREFLAAADDRRNVRELLDRLEGSRAFRLLAAKNRELSDLIDRLGKTNR